MTDNLHISNSDFFAISDYRTISLKGPDVAAFAHAQFASDVQSLTTGTWQWSVWLTAKGRVIATFLLVRPEDERIVLVVPDADTATMVEQLKRFVFRRKVQIETSDWIAAGNFARPQQATDKLVARLHDDGFEIAYGSDTEPRTLRLCPPGCLPANATEDQHLRWRQADLRMGLPRLTAEQVEQWTPQQLGLAHMDAYSLRKGCYPGQEIVARTHFLGKAKREACLVELDQPVSCGTQVKRGADSVGTIISVAGQLALAVLPLSLADESPTPELHVEGHRANVRWPAQTSAE